METVIAVGLSSGALYGLFALGQVLVYRSSRTLNFAQAEIGAFGTFVAWSLLRAGVGWPFAALLALIAAGGIGALFERSVARGLLGSPPVLAAVGTVALGLLLGGVETKLWGLDPKALSPPFEGAGISIGGVVLPPPRLVALGLGAGTALVATWFFRRTTFGIAVIAAAEGVDGVRLTGIRARHLSAFTWGVSSMVGAVAGLVIALSFGAFGPFFMTRVMLLGFAAAVIGGMTSLVGAMLGGLLVGIVEASIGHVFISVPGVTEIAMFGAIVLVLMVRPRGLLGSAW